MYLYFSVDREVSDRENNWSSTQKDDFGESWLVGLVSSWDHGIFAIWSCNFARGNWKSVALAHIFYFSVVVEVLDWGSNWSRIQKSNFCEPWLAGFPAK